MPLRRAKRRSSLKLPRLAAFRRQGGLCYYCGAPMWLSDPAEFAARFGIPESLAVRLRCTGEHLVAWQDGGGNSRSNIVAACWFCNRTRHLRSSPPSPDAYQQDVQRRLRRGKWHPLEIHRLVAFAPPK